MKYKALIAFDWADKKHDGCISVGGKREHFKVTHSPEAIHEWAAGVRRRFRRGKIAIILELKSGPLFSALLKYDFFDLYPVNPKTLAKYR